MRQPTDTPWRSVVTACVLLACAVGAVADDQAVENLRVRPDPRYIPPKGYVCFRTTAKPTIDGRLDETAWQQAPWTEDFGDIEGDAKPAPRFRTRAKMLWDDEFFYVAAELEEPHVWGTLTKHDSVIFQDNDFEVFVDPDGDGHNYGEFEINALNTGWDLRLPIPYKDGGSADDGWEIPGLKTGVAIEGTLNDPSDTDKRWTIELAFPWKVLSALKAKPPEIEHSAPRDREQWRVNFSRVEWKHEIADGKYRKIPNMAEDNWVWSPQYTVNMHRPETWGVVQFSTAKAGSRPAREVRFTPDPAGQAKYQLTRIYYAQQAHRSRHGEYADVITKLDLTRLDDPSLVGEIRLTPLEKSYRATATIKTPDGTEETWHISHDARIWKD
ncbi:MAG: carbohydrate-binding family 9-like protein [Planctomycetota bacterium]|nr:carbohydrate-binding family 9-like protein [Planctomycetota bacterium]